MFKFAVVLFILLLALSVAVIINDSSQRKTSHIIQLTRIETQKTTKASDQSRSKNYLPKVSEVQSKYSYTYYEAYTFSYRYASVKASIAGDNYWIRFYAKHWDKYAHDKGHPNRLSQARFWEIMEHADREANK